MEPQKSSTKKRNGGIKSKSSTKSNANPGVSYSVKWNNLCPSNNDIKELQNADGNRINSNLRGYNAKRLSSNLNFTLLIM